jgi:hypothetical protein
VRPAEELFWSRRDDRWLDGGKRLHITLAFLLLLLMGLPVKVAEQDEWRVDFWPILFGAIAVASAFLPSPVRGLGLLAAGWASGGVTLPRFAMPEVRWVEHLAAVAAGGLLVLLRHPRPRRCRWIVLIPVLGVIVMLFGMILADALRGHLAWPPTNVRPYTELGGIEDWPDASIRIAKSVAYSILAAALLVAVLTASWPRRWAARLGTAAITAGIVLAASLPTGAEIAQFHRAVGSFPFFVHNWPGLYASHLQAFVAFLATMGLLIAGYASLWLLDPKRKPRARR